MNTEDSDSYPTKLFTGHQSTPTEVSGQSPGRKREFPTSKETVEEDINSQKRSCNWEVPGAIKTVGK